MCGIAGVNANDNRAAIEGMLVKMSAAIAHRGPDADGTWIAPNANIGFAHRRLSIIDLSTAANQPMTSASGRYVLTYNGEIYNFQQLRSELERADYAFRSQSDTEVILAGIEIWGLEGALERFIGMFAFALWDADTGSVRLVRDRLGVKPLYYGFNQGQWAFASELKALESIDFLDYSLSMKATSLYLRYGYVPAPQSIYSGINKVPAGGIVTLDAKGSAPRVSQYWDIVSVAEHGQESRASYEPAEVVEKFAALLDDAVKLRMIADVPLGAFLSGGVDSSAVVAMMRRHSAQKIRTFTIGFHEPKMNEAIYARQVADHLGTDHHEQYIGQAELAQYVDDITAIGDEPFADASILPTYILSRLAATEVKVVLSGDGGDELFAGYTHYQTAADEHAKNAKIPRAVRRIYGNALQALNGGAGKLARIGAMRAADTSEELCRGLLSHWQRPTAILQQGENDDALWGDRNISFRSDISSYLMLRDSVRYLPDDILHKVDRASMATGLEARNPLLDHRIVEFAWQLPYALKRRNGETKWPLRQLLERHVPNSLIDRPKHGFGVPVSSWLSGDLRGWAEDLLNGPAANEIFDGPRIRSIWNRRMSGKRRRGGSHLWDILVFLNWIKHSRATY